MLTKTATSEPRMVKASKYLDWWRRLSELDNQHSETMTDLEWQGIGRETRRLRMALEDHARHSGASHFEVRVISAEGLTTSLGDVPNPHFDWANSAIDVGTHLIDSSGDPVPRGEDLIRRVVAITDIPEEDE